MFPRGDAQGHVPLPRRVMLIRRCCVPSLCRFVCAASSSRSSAWTASARMRPRTHARTSAAPVMFWSLSSPSSCACFVPFRVAAASSEDGDTPRCFSLREPRGIDTSTSVLAALAALAVPSLDLGRSACPPRLFLLFCLFFFVPVISFRA